MEYVEEILCFLVMGALVVQLAPNESCRKIMRFFISLMLLMFVLNAVSSFFKLNRINYDIPDIRMNSKIDYQTVFDRYYDEEVSDEESQ